MKLIYPFKRCILLVFILGAISCKKDNGYKETIKYENKLTVINGYMNQGLMVKEPIANADVRLYNAYTDFAKDENPILELKSDNEGFCKLQDNVLPKYWIRVNKDEYSNIINNQINIDSIEFISNRSIFKDNVTTTYRVYNVYLFPKMVKVDFNIKVANKVPKFASVDLYLNEEEMKKDIKITSSMQKYYLPVLFRDSKSTLNGSLFFKDLEFRKYWYRLLADGKFYFGQIDMSNEVEAEKTVEVNF